MHISSHTALPAKYNRSQNSESVELSVWLAAIIGLIDEIHLIAANRTVLTLFLFI